VYHIYRSKLRSHHPSPFYFPSPSTFGLFTSLNLLPFFSLVPHPPFFSQMSIFFPCADGTLKLRAVALRNFTGITGRFCVDSPKGMPAAPCACEAPAANRPRAAAGINPRCHLKNEVNIAQRHYERGARCSRQASIPFTFLRHPPCSHLAHPSGRAARESGPPDP